MKFKDYTPEQIKAKLNEVIEFEANRSITVNENGNSDKVLPNMRSIMLIKLYYEKKKI